ncbi:MAG: DUF3877 family protein [Lachnospira sp.]
MGFDRLEESLIDLIKEEEAKLGYRKEVIRLYYPLSTLNHFFQCSKDSDSMYKMLEGFSDYTANRLGNVTVTYKGDRFCFKLPQEGVEYIHNNTSPNEFIRELVNIVGKHGCTMDEIKELFESHGEIICDSVDNDEFDILIRFVDSTKDKYFYCFKDEGCHIIYHRFLPEDYADFDF